MRSDTPTVTKSDIDRIILRDYPDHELVVIWDVLKLYGHGEAFRIYAAALKEGKGDVARLKEMIALANIDYRDLLVAAEYPRQQTIGLFQNHSVQTLESDSTQYYEWFNKK